MLHFACHGGEFIPDHRNIKFKTMAKMFDLKTDEWKGGTVRYS